MKFSFCKHVTFGLYCLIGIIACNNGPGQTKSDENPVFFPSVQIGDQVWMSRNYDATSFRNGDPIPHIQTVEGWDSAAKAGRPAWCYYKNDSSTAAGYGRIYNWYAISDPRGFSPAGWHVPTNDEWIAFENFLGVHHAGLKMKLEAFAAQFGGYRGKEGGFSGIGEFTYLASASERDPKLDDVWGRGLNSRDSSVMRCGLFKGHGVYVRLIKD